MAICNETRTSRIGLVNTPQIRIGREDQERSRYDVELLNDEDRGDGLWRSVAINLVVPKRRHVILIGRFR